MVRCQNSADDTLSRTNNTGVPSRPAAASTLTVSRPAGTRSAVIPGSNVCICRSPSYRKRSLAEPQAAGMAVPALALARGRARFAVVLVTADFGLRQLPLLVGGVGAVPDLQLGAGAAVAG